MPPENVDSSFTNFFIPLKCLSAEEVELLCKYHDVMLKQRSHELITGSHLMHLADSDSLELYWSFESKLGCLRFWGMICEWKDRGVPAEQFLKLKRKSAGISNPPESQRSQRSQNSSTLIVSSDRKKQRVSDVKVVLKHFYEEQFLCPITQTIMEDPVVCTDGHSYERAAITTWLKKNPTSPVTKESMYHGCIVPNLCLKSAIETLKSSLNGIVGSSSQYNNMEEDAEF